MELIAHRRRPPHEFRFQGLISRFHCLRLAVRSGLVLLALSAVLTAHAALQFDVFLGYGGQPTGTDGIIREAGWFPVACEVLNDGPPFNAVFEVSSSQMGAKRLAVELPTNTRKRFVIPMFAASGTYAAWEARLLDERGKVHAEKTGLRPRGIAWEGILMGAVPRTFAGIPKLPELRGNNSRTPLQPLVARLQAELMPDSPIALEGMDAIYLNSEKALELKVTQAEALVAWVLGGGHLIVGVEQPADVNAAAWLKPLMPMTLTGGETRRANREVFDWLRSSKETETTPDIPARAGGARNRPLPPGSRTANTGFNPYADLPDDAEFNQTDFPVATGSLREGRTLLSVQGTPLIVTANRGRGQVTVLTFSPEREPFRSWKNREWFWAKVTRVPPGSFSNDPMNAGYGGSSIDGVFGSMIDSRQVRKLPVQWLLLLLVVYLLVIGPVDQYCLKKAGKQMLTWLTFPLYVVFFSLLIYYIGYKLRAGETEWNELHVVDILPQGESAQWRGRTYASVYSPVNARYKLAGEQTHATLRGEFMGLARSGAEGSRSEVLQRDKGFDAVIEVPVWTSQLYVSDWGESSEVSLAAAIVPQGANRQLNLRNDLGLELKEVRVILQDRIYEIGDVPAGRSMTVPLDQSKSVMLRDFIAQNGSQFQMAVQQRQYAFGDNAQRWVDLNPRTVAATCFPSQVLPFGPQQRGFVYPAGMDLTPLIERGDAVLLAWAPGHSPSTTPLNRFKTVRSQRNTMFRLAIPSGQPANL